MRKTVVSLLFVCISATSVAQVVSRASSLKARPKADVTIPFKYLDEGIETPIEWGLDLAWLSEGNIHRGVNFAGKDLIDIVRTSYRSTESVEDGALSEDQISYIRQRAVIIKKFLNKDVALNINHDHPDVNEWYNAGSAGTQGRGQRWAKLIDLTIKEYAALGLTNLVSISPYNEPDFGWGQGYSDNTRKSDFLAVAKSLKEDYNGAYDGVRICGGNTLNDDCAYDWWNFLKSYLDEGNTHQLAGSFNNYANFFQKVRDYGHHASADELHNTMEAMVGVEYGMQTGIWWGTCEHSRSQFMKATSHRNPGKRLAYGEHRNNWTAASVYRLPDGRVQAFGGTSERQGVETTYRFVSADMPVWYNGEPGREYIMTLPGGTGYQQGQSNAETVVDLQCGTDIMPHIDGVYKVVNLNSNMLMGFGAAPSTSWTAVCQQKNGTKASLQWIVNPVPLKCGDDFSYYSFTLNTDNELQLDILNWGLDAGAEVGTFPGGMGGNEQWFLEYAGEGAFYIRSRHSAKYLEVKNSSKLVSAKLQMADFTGEKNQQWRFLPVNVTPDIVAPNAPTELQATSQTASVRLDWTPSDSKDVDHYVVLRSDNGTDYYTIANDVVLPSFTDNEVADGETYSYQVYAVDKSYNYSETTNSVSAMASGNDDCVMYLPFEYTLNDTTVHGNHCALYGEKNWLAGKVGVSAIRLNGTDNFIQLPYTVANHDQLTIACWVNWRGGSAWQRIWDFGTGTSQYMFLTPKGDNGMRFAIKDEGAEQQITVTTLPVNTWVHLAVTIGTDGARLYVNGELKGTNTNVTISPNDFRPMLNYIGRSQFASDPNFKGNIDDFRIYNYALSADEIKALTTYTDAIASPQEGTPFVESMLYDLSGRRASNRSKGVLLKNGKKVLR